MTRAQGGGWETRSQEPHEDERSRSERRGCMFLGGASAGLSAGLGVRAWGGRSHGFLSAYLWYHFAVQQRGPVVVVWGVDGQGDERAGTLWVHRSGVM